MLVYFIISSLVSATIYLLNEPHSQEFIMINNCVHSKLQTSKSLSNMPINSQPLLTSERIANAKVHSNPISNI